MATAKMAQSTYGQLQKQIEDLQAQAEKVKQREVEGVVAKIRDAIQVYGLTAEDLFRRRAETKKKTKTKNAVKVRAPGTQYSDGAGNSWGGRGPRPQWLRDALAAGRQLNDFAVGAASRVITPEATPDAKTARAGKGSRTTAGKKGAVSKKVPGVIRFRDSNGNAWTGFGPKPAWLKAAIGAGKSADDFRV